MRRIALRVYLGLLLGLCSAPQAEAIEELRIEEDISDLLAAGAQPTEDTAATRQWAVLPQLGYAPDTGPVVGIKFTHRNLLNSGTTLDVDGTYAALSQQQGLGISIEQPHISDDRFLAVFRLKYEANPQREFFDLGNNEIGPDPASTNSFQNVEGDITLGWRPFQSLAVNFTVGLRKVNIGRGDRLDRCDDPGPDGAFGTPDDTHTCPFTGDKFPDLPGVHGGATNHFALSLVWDNRDSVVRPTRGWRGILKVIHTNKALFSDFEFTRYIADLGYVRAFWDQRLVLGIRADGEWIDGPTSKVPYWELAELGGEDTMRGFFPHRFVGKARVLLNGEIRFLLSEFDFFDLWHVKIDGVLFGDGGRVFLDQSDAKNEFKLDKRIFERFIQDFQYSYGGGLRIALGQALVARIDAGFSEEETGLIYLSFGQTF